jgi:hypothetical protein
MPPPQSPAYVLVEELREPSALATIHRPPPDELEREELLLRKLGPRGWGRVHHFRNYYQSGWGEQHGQVLSPKALEAFFRFLEAVDFPAAKTSPSVFLTDKGGVELSWEDADGRPVQVEFTRERMEYYREATGEEGTMGHDVIVQLSRRLTS